jgi:hypothetical protein
MPEQQPRRQGKMLLIFFSLPSLGLSYSETTISPLRLAFPDLQLPCSVLTDQQSPFAQVCQYHDACVAIIGVPGSNDQECPTLILGGSEKGTQGPHLCTYRFLEQGYLYPLGGTGPKGAPKVR